MEFYEKLPDDFLIRFYNEIQHNIEKGILTKKMYYELGLIISVSYSRGIVLDYPSDFEEEVNMEMYKELLLSLQIEGRPCA